MTNNLVIYRAMEIDPTAKPGYGFTGLISDLNRRFDTIRIRLGFTNQVTPHRQS